jgi:hypothetical protein
MTKKSMTYLFYGTLWLFFAGIQPAFAQKNTFKCTNGKVVIRSDAPLERIEAESKQLRGALDPATQSFAWVVDIKTVKGFNSALQQDHFNENYLESDRFPTASFSGKIIEKVDFQTNGPIQVRAKGKLLIHGVELERIIKVKMDIQDSQIVINSSFSVLLADHGIAIPRIVYQKIAEEILVKVDGTLKYIR